jgi:hypothetical protein
VKLEPDPARQAYAEQNREPMRDAIRKVDVRRIRAIVDGAPKLKFTIGGHYALCVFGAPPAPARQGDVEHVDQAIGKLVGMDPVDTLDSMAVLTIRGTYKGRDSTILRPHVFRAANGQSIVLADMDILAWSRA